MGIGRQLAVGRGVKIGEIAAATARDEDLLAGPVGMIDEQDLSAALPGDCRAHQPCAAGAEDDRVIGRGRQDDSWLRRSSAFLSTSYAAWTAWKRSAASLLSGLVSG